MENKKSENSPLTYILIGVVLVLGFQYFSSNGQKENSSGGIGFVSPTDDPYAGCIGWQETAYHDGETVCVIGRVLFVSSSYDDFVQQNVWEAHFGNTDDSFTLRAWGENMEKWDGRCVLVRGKLVDRAAQDPQFRNPSPLMVNHDSNHDFMVSEIFDQACR